MKKIILFLSIVTIFATANAQVRYLDDVFSAVDLDSNITYGQNYDYGSNFTNLVTLQMDLYSPAGDTATNRPVIILAHAGSFLSPAQTGFDWATRKQNCLVEMSRRFAKKGYVVISMSYRLGWAFSSPDAETRAKTIINAVYLAMQDMKGCVRYLKENHTVYGIDTTKIVLGGTNSGAYVALAAGTLNKTAELMLPKVTDINNQPFINQTLSGDFDGFGGTQNNENYTNHSSAFRAIISLGGAVADTVIMEDDEVPIIGFHGVVEQGTPYNTAIVTTTTGQPVIVVSGAGDYMQYVEKFNNNAEFVAGNFRQGPANKLGNGTITQPIDGLYPFYGQGFEPWSWYDGFTQPIGLNPTATMAKGMKYVDTIMGYTTPRLYRLLINSSYVSLDDLNPTDVMASEVFPNPVTNIAYVKVTESEIELIQIRDLSGKVVFEKEINAQTARIDLANLANGNYILSGKLQNGKSVRGKVAVVH